MSKGQSTRDSGLSLCRSPFILLSGNLIQNLPLHVDASYQVSVHMAKQFQRRRLFRNRSIRNKNCMWGPCLLTDRDEMSNLHRGHSIDASYQVSVVAMFVNWSGRNDQVWVHLTKRFQRRRFLKIGQSETRIGCGGHVW